MVGSGIAFRTETETLFDKGRKLAARIRGSDVTDLVREIGLHLTIPGRATYGTDLKMYEKVTVAQHNREFILTNQKNLRQIMAGYLAYRERTGRLAEGIAELFDAYKKALQLHLEGIKSELASVINVSARGTSLIERRELLESIRKDARTMISRETGVTGKNLDSLVARALENDERWSYKYSRAKRELRYAQNAAEELTVQRRKLEQVIKKLPEIEKATEAGAEAVAKSLSGLFKVPGRLAVLPTKTKIATVVIISMTLGFIYGLATENNEPKTIRPVKIK